MLSSVENKQLLELDRSAALLLLFSGFVVDDDEREEAVSRIEIIEAGSGDTMQNGEEVADVDVDEETTTDNPPQPAIDFREEYKDTDFPKTSNESFGTARDKVAPAPLKLQAETISSPPLLLLLLFEEEEEHEDFVEKISG